MQGHQSLGMSPRGCHRSGLTLEVCAGEGLGCGSLNSRETPESHGGEEEEEKTLVGKEEEQCDEENKGVKSLKSIFFQNHFGISARGRGHCSGCISILIIS